MKYGSIPGLAKPVSRLAHGCMMLEPKQLEWSFNLLDEVFALGCNTFDLAHVYGGGGCERVFGQWVRERGLRDKVVILTKGCHPNADRKRVTPFDLASDIHDSLARLKVDMVDIHLLHRDDPALPVGPIVEAYNEHARAGRLTVFGGSNWMHTRVAEANAYAKAHGLTPFTASSPNYSLAEMVKSPWGDDCISISGPANEEARRWYAQEKMPLFTWSSLARGFFSGAISRGNLEGLRSADNSSVHTYCHEVNFKRLDRVEILASEKGATVTQIAMAYVANTPLNIFSLIGCYSGAEFKQCIEAWEMKLTPEEMAWLDLRKDDH
ncbi:MAG: aldo/keto reductase [Candidatus Sumerlaeota bacterium]|nr:aldo/keto reductase [Candidatus Sumerlaeota bacterium]